MSDYRMHRKFVRGSVGAGVDQGAIIDSSGDVVNFALSSHTHPDPTFPVTDDDLALVQGEVDALEAKTIDLSDYTTPGYATPTEDAGVALTTVLNPTASDYDDVTYAKNDVVPLGAASSIVIKIPNANNVNSYIVQRLRSDGTVLDTWQGTSFRYASVNGHSDRFYTLGTTNEAARFSFPISDRLRIRAFTTTKHSLYTGATILPSIDTAHTPQTGELRRTATNDGVEIYNGSAWVAVEAADLTGEEEITKINTATSGIIDKERLEQRTGDETIGSINRATGTINASRVRYDDAIRSTEVYSRNQGNLQNQRWYSTNWTIPEDGLFFLEFGTLTLDRPHGISEVFSASHLRSKSPNQGDLTTLDNKAIKVAEGTQVGASAATAVYICRNTAYQMYIFTVSGDGTAARPLPLKVHELTGAGTSSALGDKRVFFRQVDVTAANTWVEVPWQVPSTGAFRIVFGATQASGLPSGTGKVFSAELLRAQVGTVTAGETSLEHGIKILDDNPSGSVALVDASAGITAGGRLALSFSDVNADPSVLEIYQMTSQDDPDFIRGNTHTPTHTQGTAGTFSNPAFLGEFSTYRGSTHRTTGRSQALLGGSSFNLDDFNWLILEHRRVNPYRNGQWMMTRGNLTSIREFTLMLDQQLISTSELDTQATSSPRDYRKGATLACSFTGQGGFTAVPSPIDAFDVPDQNAYQTGYRISLLGATAGDRTVTHFQVWDWFSDAAPYFQSILCVYGIE